MIHSICKEHDWVEVFTYLNDEIIATNYQCRNCGVIKGMDFKIPENLEVVANENIWNAENYYKDERSNKL